MLFLRDLKIYVGLDLENIKTISTYDSCKINLSHLCKEREQTMKKFKSSIFISSNMMKEYGCSEHILKICKVIKEIQNDPKVFVDETTARDIRNYLMLLMCYTNCLRASNVVSITVHDVLEAKKHEEIEHAFFFSNNKYKTSLIYGEKITVVSEDFYEQLKTFIKHIRVQLIDDKDKDKLRHLFMSSTKNTGSSQMTPSLVSQCPVHCHQDT